MYTEPPPPTHTHTPLHTPTPTSQHAVQTHKWKSKTSVKNMRCTHTPTVSYLQRAPAVSQVSPTVLCFAHLREVEGFGLAIFRSIIPTNARVRTYNCTQTGVILGDARITCLLFATAVAFQTLHTENVHERPWHCLGVKFNPRVKIWCRVKGCEFFI